MNLKVFKFIELLLKTFIYIFKYEILWNQKFRTQLFLV